MITKLVALKFLKTCGRLHGSGSYCACDGCCAKLAEVFNEFLEPLEDAYESRLITAEQDIASVKKAFDKEAQQLAESMEAEKALRKTVEDLKEQLDDANDRITDLTPANAQPKPIESKNRADSPVDDGNPIEAPKPAKRVRY